MKRILRNNSHLDGTLEVLWHDPDNMQYVYLLQRGDYVVQRYLSECSCRAGGCIDNLEAWRTLEKMIADDRMADHLARGLSPYGTVMGL